MLPSNSGAIERVAESLERPPRAAAHAAAILRRAAAVAAQAPHYPEIQAPVIVITGDRDNTVSPRIHSEAIAAVLPRVKLIVLPGIGHMLHHAAAERVIAAIDEVASVQLGRD